MPRAPEPLDDVTPLDAARIDVPVRIGWLLRTHRTVAGLSLRDMAAALGERGVRLSAATLSRMETEGHRPAAVLDGYERVLGLPVGQLRTTGTMLSHTFPYTPPAPPETVARDLGAFSRACDAVSAAAPTAGEWLEFARHHAGEVTFGLPLSAMEPLVARLLSEVGRSVREARMIRHDALVTLLRSPYHDLVSGMVREAIDDPDHQLLLDLSSIISDAPTRTTLLWAGDRLSGPTSLHVQGAVNALLNLLVTGGLGLEVWRELVPSIERAWDEADGDPWRTSALRTLCAALPLPVQADLRTAYGHQPALPHTTVEWSRSTSNVHYAFALGLAREITARQGQQGEPLLARLLFEGFHEPRLVRRAMGAWLVALSAFGDTAMDVLLDLLDSSPDADTRSAALRVAAVCHRGQDVAGLPALLEQPIDVDFFQVLNMVGRSGATLPEASLRRGLAGDQMMVRQSLYCLGMAGDPRLSALAGDATSCDVVRRAAAWWLQQGSRILA